MFSALHALERTQGVITQHRIALIEYICHLKGYREFICEIFDCIQTAVDAGMTDVVVDGFGRRAKFVDKFETEEAKDRSRHQWQDDLRSFGFEISIPNPKEPDVVRISWANAKF